MYDTTKEWLKNEAFKIPDICHNKRHCIRGHQGYMYYKITDRSKCPQICPLIRESNVKHFVEEE